MYHIKILVCLIIVINHPTIKAKDIDIDPSKNCVAWKAKKTLLLISDQEPIGINCDITTKLLTSPGSSQVLSVIIPVAGFNSGEEDRDELVKHLLGSPQKELSFVSERLPLKNWQTHIEGRNKIKGSLRINGKVYPVTAEYKITAGFAQGSITTKLSRFGIEPPEIAGGLVASVEDYIQLQFNLNLQKVLKEDTAAKY